MRGGGFNVQLRFKRRRGRLFVVTCHTVKPREDGTGGPFFAGAASADGIEGLLLALFSH